jgi:hypothetical protein
LRTYLPPRYFVPLVVPVVFLIGGSIPALLERFKGKRRISLAIISLVACIGIVNFAQIVRFMGQLQYTVRDMGVDISRRIHSSAVFQPVYLVGNLADSVSMITGIPGINTQLGYKDLNWRLDTYHPQFYVSLGVDSREVRRLNKRYRLREMATYQVFGDYYHNKSVYLYQLIDLPNPN